MDHNSIMERGESRTKKWRAFSQAHNRSRTKSKTILGADNRSGKKPVVISQWCPGPRSAAWDELWKRILGDVLHGPDDQSEQPITPEKTDDTH